MNASTFVDTLFVTGPWTLGRNQGDARFRYSAGRRLRFPDASRVTERLPQNRQRGFPIQAPMHELANASTGEDESVTELIV